MGTIPKFFEGAHIYIHIYINVCVSLSLNVYSTRQLIFGTEFVDMCEKHMHCGCSFSYCWVGYVHFVHVLIYERLI